MMKIRLIQTGKTHFSFIKDGFDLYEKKLGHYVNFSYTEIQVPNKDKHHQPEAIKKSEALLQLKLLKPTDFLILLDEKGKSFNSIQFANYLEKLSMQTSSMVFLIGGAFGFDESVYQRANAKIALSDFTFSHQLVRLIFAEQLYRAQTIIKGEPYHHE
jgi:23S rRNA (pseudouridine1915-N3)-methyltransferase